MKKTVTCFCAFLCLSAIHLTAKSTLTFKTPRDFRTSTLRVSDNHRFLQTADGKPFFYLGDTAWELFHRLTKEEAKVYLKIVRKKDLRSYRLWQ